VRSTVEGALRAPEKTFSRARELRRQMSLPEVVLWQALRQGRLAGLRFRRQHPVGPYILDFYCASASLAHDSAAQVRHDQRRDAFLIECGVRVLRITAADVLRDERLEGALIAIVQAAAVAPSGSPGSSPGSPPPPRAGEDHEKMT
jgi:very-short-patch-repair endonuclease